tara:strand:- start:1082 stop:4264 length:3183 start_codon:yes stop_codon:yes gene_type:complete
MTKTYTNRLDEYVVKVYKTLKDAESGSSAKAIDVEGYFTSSGSPFTLSNETNDKTMTVGSTTDLAVGMQIWDHTSKIREDTKIDSITSSTSLEMDKTSIRSGTAGVYFWRPGQKNRIDINTAGTDGFWTHKKYFYRIDATTPCKKFYIDWDDGEDNDRKGKANYTMKEFEIPQKTAIIEHTYTKHGAFFPKLTLTNKEGYESKFYTPSFGSLYKERQVSTITTVAATLLDGTYFIIYDGDNQGYYIWIDTAGGTKVIVPEGYTGVEITTIGSGNSAATVADKVATAIHAIPGFSATDASTTVTFTNGTAGKCNFPQAGTTGFTMAVTTYGNKNEFILKDGNAMTPAPVASREEFNFLEIDSLLWPRIPFLVPTNVPPVSVLKVDRTQIYAGIDNQTLSNNNNLGYLYLDGKDSYDAGVTSINGVTGRSAAPASNKIDNIIQITWKDQLGIIHNETKSVATVDGASAVAGAIVGTAGSVYMEEVLEIKLLDLREGDAANTDRLYPYERVHLLAYTTGDNPLKPIGNVGEAALRQTVAQVSLGNPLVSINENKFIATFDGSESYARNSNVNIKNYSFDLDKFTQADAAGTFHISNITDTKQVSDVFNFEKQLSPIKTAGYTFDIAEGDQVDRNLRFFTTERLIRLQVQDNSEDTKMADEDNINYSAIEHYDSSALCDGYSSAYPDFLKSKGALIYINTYNDGGGVEWVNLATLNRIQSKGSGGVIFGGALKDSSTGLYSATAATADPDCFVVLSKEELFNKIHFKLNNVEEWGTSLLGTDTNIQTSVRLWYSTTSGWKPVSFYDGTEIFKNRTSAGPSDGIDSKPRSLATSGSIVFDVPVDWSKETPRRLSLNSGVALTNLIGTVPQTGTGSADPDDLWNFEGYAILIGISPGSNNDEKSISQMNVYNNAHSQAIKIIDPMHVSLNNIKITDNISYSRRGTHSVMTNKFGRSEIRKMGAAGGAISFGSIDLDKSVGGSREIIVKHQKDGTPVYIDIAREDGTFIRFFGIITDVSEEHRTGKQFSKYSITLQIEYIIEYAADGKWKRPVPIGGELINERKFTY